MKKDNSYSFELVSKYKTELYGVSIIWIMIFHSNLCECTWDGVFKLFDLGNTGVEIFLFISGISLYFSWINNPDIWQFYKKRALRLFVPIGLICVPYWIYLLVTNEINISRFFLKVLTLDFWVTGNQQIWFVSFLIICYLIYPFLYRFIFTKERQSVLRTLLLIVIILGITISIRIFSEPFFDRVEIALTRFPVFILGCLTGKYVYEKKKISKQVLILCLGGIFLSFWIRAQGILTGFEKRYFYMLGGISIVLLCSYILDLIHFYLGNSLLRFVGKMSLECYLVHMILIQLYKSGKMFITYVPGSKRFYLIVILCSVIIAYIFSRINLKISQKLKLKMIKV